MLGTILRNIRIVSPGLRREIHPEREFKSRMNIPRNKSLHILIAALALAFVLLLLAGCGDDSGSGSDSGNPLEERTLSAEDKAARLAAQTQLRNAQMSMETYYVENGTYPSSASQLKEVDPRMSANVKVVSGSGSGYEISLEANDSDRTVYIVRKTGSRTEHIDEEGNAW